MHTALDDGVLDAKQFCDSGFHFLRFVVGVGEWVLQRQILRLRAALGLNFGF
jgi:hypothetical protein